MPNTIATRLQQLRELMQQHNLDFYFVPARDAHNNEYLPACWLRRGFISGFTGSAGDVLVGKDTAFLWTDPRYFLQAEQELDASLFTLMKQQQGMAAPIHEWLADNAAGKRVGTDPKLLTAHQQFLWESTLAETGGKLIDIEENLVDAIWTDQPDLPAEPVTHLGTEYAGVSAKDKITALRKALNAQHCNAHVITMLDAIAWLLNIRGKDISYNPLSISYALVTDTEAVLFIDERKLDDAVKAHCAEAGLTIKGYEDVANTLQSISGQCLIETTTASWWIAQQIQQAEIHAAPSPITMMKAIKNPTEIAGMREAHRKDGLALCKLFHWLEHNWQGQTELSVSQKVNECRAEDPQSRGPSFATISGYAAHGAIIHYFVTEETDQPISDQTLYLIDSGGQYLEGTTDVTRTIHLGIPSAEEKRHYTLVLKGHLALRHLKFPEGTCGEQINAIAHQPLWQQGLDFGHGTGHGVGCYLCVHEGPQRISGAYTRVPLVPGMIVSNEPGLYITGQYGIRIENLCLISEKIAAKDSLTESVSFLGCEDLTLYPYETKLIDTTLLSSEELDWINRYHETVFKSLQADCSAEIREWLKAKTAAI